MPNKKSNNVIRLADNKNTRDLVLDLVEELNKTETGKVTMGIAIHIAVTNELEARKEAAASKTAETTEA